MNFGEREAVCLVGYGLSSLWRTAVPCRSTPRSTDGASTRIAENKRFAADAELQALVKSTPPVGEMRFGDYAAIFLPGGHGTMWDLPTSAALAGGVSEMYAAGKPVAAVCHGPACLIGATAPTGRPPVAGSPHSPPKRRSRSA